MMLASTLLLYQLESLASAGAIINGMGSCLTLSLPAMLSSTWFPMEERATATAVAAVATQLGGAGMYLSPLLVRTPDDILTKDEIANDIFILMYIQTPSIVCDYRLCLFQCRYPYWVSIMNFSLECLGVAQTESMWIAITACLASPLFSFVVARVTDHSYGYLKVTILGLLLSSSCFYIWILLMTETVASSSYAALFVAVVFAISLQYSSVPLLIELAAELAYPCPESVIGAILTIMMDIVDTVFLLVLMVFNGSVTVYSAVLS
ncbi:Disrupted in renal carcinoma protein 2-like protein [Armadillidium vulgare]|nr:Disrupted in renal carcinoma protein 2-like protein [Armadillidium vulgare]